MTSKLVWKIVGCVVAVPMLVFGATQTAFALAHSQRTETATVPADDLTGVDVSNSAGRVRIIGVEGGTSVKIRARIDDGWRASGHSVTTENGVLKVHGNCPNYGSTWCRVRYTIEVPNTLPVSIRAEGSIEVTDMTGGVEASSDSSPITLARVDGDLELDADQGSITAGGIRSARVSANADQGRISLVFAASPDAVTAEADQGSIEIVLPDRTVAFATDVGADQGDVTDLVDRDLDSPRSIVAHADQGDVTLTYASSS
jgi:hypothetical protein